MSERSIPYWSPLSDIEQEDVFVDPSEVRSAKLSWIIPLFGIAIGFFSPQLIHVLFLLGIPIGLCFSFYVFTIRNKTARFCRHFAAGIIVNLTLIILLVVSYFALREIRELENRPGLVAPAQKPPGETKLK